MMDTHKMPNGTVMKGSMMKGGMINQTGMYKLHKGEMVVTKSRVKGVNSALAKDGKRPLKK
tara:strand:+ start:2120 stop:2302 length:183 start_codon:yes stop_codon:yes gene_type:complete